MLFVLHARCVLYVFLAKNDDEEEPGQNIMAFQAYSCALRSQRAK